MTQKVIVKNYEDNSVLVVEDNFWLSEEQKSLLKIPLGEVNNFSSLPASPTVWDIYLVNNWEATISYPFWKTAWRYEYTATGWKRLGWLNEKIVSRQVVDNLTSTNTDKALSANQGKILKDKQDKKVWVESQSFTTAEKQQARDNMDLWNVDNTSDSNKPISTATQTALNWKEDNFTKNTAFNKDFWTASGTVCQWNDSRLSDERTPTDDSVTNAKLANMSTQTIKWRNTAGSWNPEDLTPTQARNILNVADWATANDTDANLKNRANHTGTQTANTISDFDTEVSNNTSVSSNTSHRGQTSNPHSVTKAQVGLGNVNNTSDSTKNSATATLSNKTVDADNNTISNLETDNFKSSAIDTDLSSVSTNDDTLASAKAIKVALDDKANANQLVSQQRLLPIELVKSATNLLNIQYAKDKNGYIPRLPSEINNLAGWWDSTDPTNNLTNTITNWQTINTWADKSGNNRNMTPQSGFTAPTINFSAIWENNAFPALDFSTTQNLRSTSFGLGSPYTVIYLSRMKDTGVRRRILGFEGNRIIGYCNSAETSLYLEGDIHLTAPPAQSITNNPHIYTLRTNGNNKQFWDFHNVISNTNTNTDTTANFIEANSTTFTNENSDCFISEILAFNRFLTDDEVHSMVAYLQQKYKVETQLQDIQTEAFDETTPVNNGAGGVSHRWTVNMRKAGRLVVWGKLNFWKSTSDTISASIRLNGIEQTTVVQSPTHITNTWTSSSFMFSADLTTTGNNTIDIVLTAGSGLDRVSMAYTLT